VFKLETKIDVNSAEFKKNKEDYLILLNQYREIHSRIIRGGPEKSGPEA